MRQAIVTKFIGPTNHRPSRVKAFAAAGSVIVSWDSGKGIEANHAAAARALAEKLGWGGIWYAGGLPDDKGDVFVDVSHWSGRLEEPAFTLTAREN